MRITVAILAVHSQTNHQHYTLFPCWPDLPLLQYLPGVSTTMMAIRNPTGRIAWPEEQIGTINGIRWLPRAGTFRDEGMLRVPRDQSLSDLICEFTWGAVPNFPHCLPAYKHDRQGRHIGYFRPNHLEKFTLVHARLTFQTPVPGPIIIGAGRHCGFGVCTAVDGWDFRFQI